MTSDNPELAELRTIVWRAREQAQEITRAAQAARAGLAAQRAEIRRSARRPSASFVRRTATVSSLLSSARSWIGSLAARRRGVT